MTETENEADVKRHIHSVVSPLNDRVVEQFLLRASAIERLTQTPHPTPAPRQWRFWPIGNPVFIGPKTNQLIHYLGPLTEHRPIWLWSIFWGLITTILVINQQLWSAQIYGVLAWASVIVGVSGYIWGKGTRRMTPEIEKRWCGSWAMMFLSVSVAILITYILPYMPNIGIVAILFTTSVSLFGCAIGYAAQSGYVVWRSSPNL